MHHLQPPDVEEKLQQGEDRQVKVHVVTGVSLSRIEELTADQTSQEEAVDGHRHHLRIAEIADLGPSDLHKRTLPSTVQSQQRKT